MTDTIDAATRLRRQAHIRAITAFALKADIFRVEIDVRQVPTADIGHHLFRAVVIALIRLFQFGGPLKSARQH